MHPYLIEIGKFKMPTYGFMIAIGYILSVLWISRMSEKEKLDKNLISNLIFYPVLFGFIGAKILYIITFWPYLGYSFLNRLKNVFTYETLSAGFVFYGGFIMGFLAAFYICKKNNIKFLKIADLFAPALALAHFFGRLGCFSSGCCHGRPTDSIFGVIFDKPYCNVRTEYLGLKIHPTQLYEATGNIAIFFALNYLYSKKVFKKDGYVFFLYAMSYSALRFTVEFFRGDERGDFYFGFSQAQIISLLVIIFSLIFFIYNNKNENRKNSI
jgi:phosphatidylglycerol:prolipoprotein diacylglycerol transferase